MHFTLILLVVLVAWIIRLDFGRSRQQSRFSWTMPLLQFLLPPLLLLSTAFAVLHMGMGGEMLGLPVGWVGCHLALGFFTWAGVTLLWRLVQAWRSILLLKTYPTIEIDNTTGRVLETSALFAAQVGLWNSHLIVSSGLLTQLSSEQLSAVLAHEAAHRYYRDTFWFFILGWMGSLTPWLPRTTALWQELLLYREIRADRKAAHQVDPLVLAESLLQVVQSPLSLYPLTEAAFSDDSSLRLEERVEALLSEPAPTQPLSPWFWSVLVLAGVPLLTPLLHHAALMHP
jgi:Zn-dependent protease with chaperone function